MHVEASTSARILLASLLLKFGVCGFRRFLSVLNYYNLFILFIISFLGIFICILLSLVEGDGKMVVAYSSIVHIRFVLFN